MNKESFEVVHYFSRNLSGFTFTQEEADAINESIQGYVHSGWTRTVSAFDGPEKKTTHQERVVTEKAELDEKIDKLDIFRSGSIFPTLPTEEQDRLNIQLSIMRQYSGILADRIAAF